MGSEAIVRGAADSLWTALMWIVAGSVLIGAIGVSIFLIYKAETERKPLDEARGAMWMKAEQAGINNCLKSGKAPIRSSWDGRLVDCK